MLPRLVIFIIALASSAATRPPIVRVVMDSAYAPYSFRTSDGELQGISVDQWRAWEKKTGIRVEIQAMDWGEALRRMRAGEFDVIDTIVETPARRNDFDFTPPYATIEASIFFRKEISGITDFASLRGFPVGVKAGDQHVDKLMENGVTTVIPFRNNEDIIAAAKQRKINVFVVDAPSGLYLLNKSNVAGDFRHSAPIFRDELRRAVRKGNAPLLRTVNDGFAAISPDELKRIDEKWFGETIVSYRQYLVYALYVTLAALMLIAGLAVWNRILRKKIQQRTTELETITEQLRALSARIQSAREEEGIRIARTIHDELGSVLTSLRWDLSSVAKAFSESGRQPPIGDLKRKIANMVGLTDNTIDIVRRISSELRPEILDVLGLIETICWYALEFQERTGVEIHCQSHLDEIDLNQEQSIAVFRIFQEALTNILRHSGATRVDVAMVEESGEFRLTIRDNGRGITDAEKTGAHAIGLLGMRERALFIDGKIDISGSAGEGTTVSLRVPIRHAVPASG